ncbi:YitT family protein [Aerococcaceae bacterium DSM 111020]|nr:YitT family protein [Aerococcaceae bacterium DSM 111020]
MINVFLNRPGVKVTLQALVIIFAGFGFAVGLNIFQIPGDIYAGGITGFAQLITYSLREFSHLDNVIATGNLYFLLNVPILILSIFKLGRKFTILTILVVISTTLWTNIIPVQGVSKEPLLNAIIGGTISGISGGLCVKYGMSSGGIDIISMVIYRATGINVGSMNLVINSLIVMAAGMLYSWEFALFTIISMYANARMVDVLHTNDHRMTVFIVTEQVDEVVEAILKRIRRGITIMDGKGGYSKTPRSVLMIVVNQYELHELQFAVLETDPKAFIDVIQSSQVTGNYLSKEQQDSYKNQVKKVS